MLGSLYVNIKDVCKYNTAKCIAFFIRGIKKKEKIYLVGERRDECRDNGYHLFKYVREKHKEDKFYYVIEKNSNDLSKILEYGNIIYFDSFKHYIYFFLSDTIACAHGSSCAPESLRCWKRVKKGKVKRVFIQHGITQTYQPNLIYDNSKFSKFICGAKPEYEFVQDKFGYDSKAVKYLGFCRFDNLFEVNIKNQILIMPTWRKWLNNISNEEFIQSDYYKRYNNLLNSNFLKDILEKHDLSLIFYPHYEMQKFIMYFNTNCKNIKIASKDKYDVQKLLKESMILITDYSSVFFDFAYMNKQTIYYQFDNDKYYDKHYTKGYFDFKRDGFGPVVRCEEEVISELNKILNETIKHEFRGNVKKFFPLRDKNNCYRTYREIVNDDY